MNIKTVTLYGEKKKCKAINLRFLKIFGLYRVTYLKFIEPKKLTCVHHWTFVFMEFLINNQMETEFFQYSSDFIHIFVRHQKMNLRSFRRESSQVFDIWRWKKPKKIDKSTNITKTYLQINQFFFCFWLPCWLKRLIYRRLKHMIWLRFLLWFLPSMIVRLKLDNNNKYYDHLW